MAGHTLILLRHAKSDWSTGEPDERRPLSPRGRRQAPEAGRWLAGNVDRVDLAVVSTAARARGTWQLAAAELDPVPETRHDDRVYAATAGELLDVLRELDEAVGTAVLVGHNPGLEELVGLLTGRWEPLVTSALAVVTVPSPWSGVGRGSGTLRASGRPPA
jgi:phosphohistidine phosphatase